MDNEPAGFRDRLLDAQSVTSTLRSEYQKELDVLLNHRLTPKTRIVVWAGIIVAVAFAALGIRSVVSPLANSDARLVAGAVVTASILVAIWLINVLHRGSFDRRVSFAVTEGFGSLVVGAVVMATLVGGMSAPSDPASTFRATWGLMLLIVGFAWGTGNRISAAKLELREQLFRMESRMADLAERLPK